MLYTPPPSAWPADPKPHPDCARCRELAKGRADAYRRGDLSAVSDGNVLLRHHLRERHL
ncbi:hypothetical protein ACO0M4_18105 [Streptomyces sp. RGM 3693]|uniref:hypothetical protein n=1 Tax=Streptomyces sp. RGM 3693 TaxID=3413284 RepID=UPI003D299D4B